MSRYLVYFELKNKKSTNYSGFSKVGKFNIPEKIYAGDIQVLFKEKKLSGNIISDESRLSANNFFLKKSTALHNILFDFIEERMRNECIIPCLSTFIHMNKKRAILITKIEEINIAKIKHNFSLNLFTNDNAFLIKPI